MTVKIETSGRRTVDTEFEVAGTPEQVWAAIATGPGISAWAVPTVVDEDGGVPSAIRMSFDVGMEARARITAYEAPHRLVMESDNWQPGGPPIAAEWTIHANAGGTCTLRIVQSLFATGADWDDQLETLETGWSAFLATLRIYLRHFRGQAATLKTFMMPTQGSEAEVWDTLTSALGLKGASVGAAWQAPEGAPATRGVVEYLHATPYDALVRTESPGAGIVAFGTVQMGGPTMVGVNVYGYGDGGAQTAAEASAGWSAWLQALLPKAAE